MPIFSFSTTRRWYFGGPHYSAAKAGVLGLAKAMAREFGADQIRVNSLTPGLIQTDITGGLMNDDRRHDILAGIPLGRLGKAQDVANAALFWQVICQLT